jgi:hypothetical protein
MDPCAHFATGVERIDFFIDMPLEQRLVPLSVPKNYLEDRWDHQNGAEHTAQLFRVFIDTFEPVTRQETGRLNREGVRNWMTFLIHDSVDYKSLASIHLRQADPGAESRDSASLFSELENYEFEKSSYDLLRAIPRGPDPQRDFFVTLGGGDVPNTIISCSKPREVGFAGCKHFARLNSLDASISYRRTELSNWQTIQDNVSEFLGCAVEFHNKEDL